MIIDSMLLAVTCFATGFGGAAAGAALMSRARVQRLNIAPRIDLALEERLQRFPMAVQQMLKAESELDGRRTLERDVTLSLRLDQWQAEQEASAARREARTVVELRAMLEGVARRFEPLLQAPVRPAVVEAARGSLDSPRPASLPSVSAPPAPAPAAAIEPVERTSARPPELKQTPLPRPVPVYSVSEQLRELTDEEIDALPADLPEPAAPRRRILPAPKKPTLRSL